MKRRNDGALPFVTGAVVMSFVALPVTPSGNDAGSDASLTGIAFNFNLLASDAAGFAAPASSSVSDDAISSGLPAWNEAKETVEGSGVAVELPI